MNKTLPGSAWGPGFSSKKSFLDVMQSYTSKIPMFVQQDEKWR